MFVTRHFVQAVAKHMVQVEYAAAAVALQANGLLQTIGLSNAQSKSFTTKLLHRPWSPSIISSSSSTNSNQLLRQWRSYSQCDCPTLGGPQPDVVVVEYDEEEVDRFIALADAIEAAYPNIIVEGNPDGDGKSGSFEIKDQSGQILFSRLNNGGWPEPEAVVEALGAAAACEETASRSTL